VKDLVRKWLAVDPKLTCVSVERLIRTAAEYLDGIDDAEVPEKRKL
jgi:hypothetical protein